MFAVPFALITLVRVTIGVGIGPTPLTYLVLAPLLAFGLFFLLALILQLSGIVTVGLGNELDVSVWFAWALCGALVCFFVGALIRAQNVVAGDEMRIGLYTAVGWVAFVSAVWLVTRFVRARGA